jgi:hypothetical protein
MAETIAQDGHGVGVEECHRDLAPLPGGGGATIGQHLEEHPAVET